MGYLIDNKKQSQTVRSYVSAIQTVLKDDGIKISEDQYLISSLTRACRLTNDRIKACLPIQKGLLTLILNQVIDHFREVNQPYLSALYKALFSTTYFGLLWISEVTAEAHPVLAKDVQIGSNKNKFLLILRSSKIHGVGSKPQLVKITVSKLSNIPKKQEVHQVHTNICPYDLLHKYTSMRGPYHSDPEPFFIFSDRSAVQPFHMRKCLRLMIKLSGFDEKLYDSHSLGIGRTCDLLKLGLSVETCILNGSVRGRVSSSR